MSGHLERRRLVDIPPPVTWTEAKRRARRLPTFVLVAVEHQLRRRVDRLDVTQLTYYYGVRRVLRERGHRPPPVGGGQ